MTENLELAKELVDSKNRIVNEIRKVIIGQDEVLEDLLVALFCKGHCLFVGVPGLAKTLLVKTLARVLNLSFSRIQFTPDLLPADVVGTMIYNIKENDFSIKKGNLNSPFIILIQNAFTNILGKNNRAIRIDRLPNQPIK